MRSVKVLHGRKLQIAGRWTSLRLETVMWEALHDVACRKGCSVDDLVTDIDDERRDLNLAGAIRHYVMAYYRAMMQAALRDDARSTAHEAGRGVSQHSPDSGRL
jgi:predicted DNA-binding ribbon-helix-helix protein